MQALSADLITWSANWIGFVRICLTMSVMFGHRSGPTGDLGGITMELVMMRDDSLTWV
ncbi:hypothetical protein Hanom_Chr02g00122301 [Helianthus anomalus]